MNTKAISLLLVSSLFLVACRSDEVSKNLELAVDAAISAMPSISLAANISPETQTTIFNYMQAVQGCLTVSATRLDQVNKDVAAVATDIAGACALSLLQSPALPSGTPTNITAAVASVAAALSVYIQSMPKHTAMILSHPELMSGFFDQAKKAHVDHKRLKRVRRKLKELDQDLHQ